MLDDPRRGRDDDRREDVEGRRSGRAQRTARRRRASGTRAPEGRVRRPCGGGLCTGSGYAYPHPCSTASPSTRRASRTPGLGLDAKGVALGAKGLVLLPIDRPARRVARGLHARALARGPPPSLEHPLRPLQARHAGDHARRSPPSRATAWTASPRRARLVGGFTFTGTSRHFVQYRDAARPVRLRRDRAPRDRRAARALPRPLLADVRRGASRSTSARSSSASCPTSIRATRRRSGAAHRRRRGGARAGARPLPRALARRRRGDGGRVAARRARSTRRRCVATCCASRSCRARMRALMRDDAGAHDVPARRAGASRWRSATGTRELRACPVFDPGGLVLIRGRGDEPWALPRAAAAWATSAPSRASSSAGARQRDARRGARRRATRTRCASPLRLVPVVDAVAQRDRDVDRRATSSRSSGASRTRFRAATLARRRASR